MPYIQKVRIGTKPINNIIRNAGDFLKKNGGAYFHIVNLNPEIFTYASKNALYRKIINKADEILIDGIGISILAKIVGLNVGEKLAGTDLMIKMINVANKKKKKVLLLGGFNHSSEKTAEFFQKKYPNLKIFFHPGSKNIRLETKRESLQIFTYILKIRPDFLFVAYGPPFQERWIYKNRDKLKGIVCMGVGGSFNFFSNTIRAPVIVRALFLEWLWRFIFEPNRFLKKSPIYIYFLIYFVLFSLINRVKIICLSLIENTAAKIKAFKI